MQRNAVSRRCAVLPVLPCTTLYRSPTNTILQILAPTDAAFDTLLTQLGNGRKLDKSVLLGLPELPDILSYHVLDGRYTTGE